MQNVLEPQWPPPPGTRVSFPRLKPGAWGVRPTFSPGTASCRDQPADVFVWWGCGLYPDKISDYVHKPMAQCTGREILEEVLHQLKFDADLRRIREASIVIPCMPPYITSMFLVRKQGDRPDVIPIGSTNFALLGQSAEVPKDTVFTVE